jgi:hypothetical protein
VTNADEPTAFTIYWFHGFPTTADDRVRAEGRRRGVPDGDCASNESAIAPWRSGTDAVGLLLCFADTANEAWIEWTYSRDGILVTALARDRASRSLFAWWRQVAPVLVAPEPN